MIKKYYSIILFLFIIISILSCDKEEEAPSNSKPKIEFVSIEYIEKSMNHTSPSISITIKVEDKEMDLGLDQQYRENYEFDPYTFDPIKNDSVFNPYFFNLWATISKKENDIFTNVPSPSTLGGRFPRISSNSFQYSPFIWSKTGKYKGILVWYTPVNPGLRSKVGSNPIKFEIEIIDRAKNHSNKIQTAEILIPNQ